MVNTKEFGTDRTDWYENQIKEFKNKNPKKTFSVLFWHEDQFEIADQLNTALENNVDYVFSEVLPHNLPNICNNDEYYFHEKRFVRLKPKFAVKGNFTSEKKILIIDNIFKKKFLKNKILSNQLNKVFEEVLLLEEQLTKYKIEEILKNKNIYIFTLDMNLLNLCGCIFENHKGSVFQYILESNLNFYKFLEYNIDTIIVNENKSLRDLFSNFINPIIITKENYLIKTEGCKRIVEKESTNITFESKLFEDNKYIHIRGLNNLIYQLNNGRNLPVDLEHVLLDYLLKTTALEDQNILDFVINYFTNKNSSQISRIFQTYNQFNRTKITFPSRTLEKIFSSLVKHRNILTPEKGNALIQFANFFNTNNSSSLKVQYYNFLFNTLSKSNNIIRDSIKYLEDNNTNLIFKNLTLNVLLLNKRLSNDEFTFILESNIFSIMELFTIVIKNFDIRFSNLNDKMKNKDMLFRIDKLIAFDNKFFESEFKGSISDLIRVIMSQHFGIQTLPKDHKSHTTLSKIYLHAYSRQSTNGSGIYESDEIIESLKAFEEGSFNKCIFNLLNEGNDMDKSLFDLVGSSKSYQDVRLLFSIANYFSLTKTIYKTKRLLNNYINFSDELLTFLRFSK